MKQSKLGDAKKEYETLDAFYKRSLWLHDSGVVYVWKKVEDIRNELKKPEEWTLKKAEDYVQFLETQKRYNYEVLPDGPC